MSLAVIWHYWIGLVFFFAVDPRRRRRDRRLPRQGRVAQVPEARAGNLVVVTDPVDWALAERIAVRVGGREPFAESYHYASLEPDFDELTAEAEELVVRRPPACVRSPVPPGRGSPTAPAGCGPTSRRSRGCCARSPSGSASGWARARSRRSPAAATGAELGLLLGWMSDAGARPVRPARHRGREPRRPGRRVLRRARTSRAREALRVPAARVPAVARAARGDPPGAVHRRPWLRQHFLSLVERSLDAVDPDPKRFLDALRRSVDELARGHEPARRRRPRRAARQPRAGRGARSRSAG